MTVGYASPEQIRGERLTTATDVYSLGVLLYRLLTGRHPYHLAGSPDAARMVCEKEPILPSASVKNPDPALNTDERNPSESDALARERGCEPSALRRMLKGDLDSVLLKALAKNTGERYPSVAEMAADIKRHLGGSAVKARRATFAYLTGKFVGRYWGRLLIATGVMGLIFGFAMNARSARDRAEENRAQAESLINFMLEELSNELRPLGKLQLLEQVSLEAEHYFQELSIREHTPAVVSRRILALHHIGEVRLEYGDVEKARETFEKTQILANRLVQLNPRFDEAYLRQAFGYYWLGVIAMNQTNYEAALGFFKDYEAVATTRSETDPQSKTWALEKAYAKTNIGTILMSQNALESAFKYFKDSVAIQEGVVATHPKDATAALELATAYCWLGRLLSRNARLGEALDLFSKARDLTRKLVEKEPQNSTYHAYLADSLTGWGPLPGFFPEVGRSIPTP